MIINKLIKRQKYIAVLLFSIIYLDLVMTITVYAGTGKHYTFNKNLQSEFSYSYIDERPITHIPGSTDASIKNGSPESLQISKTATLKKKDIDGPGQPEMSSFQSAGTANMVDLFTGDFSYNIPLLDVGGYPVNIHYNSGISMDQEASWVGLGWNVNPGTISRSMRGLPDDFNGKDSIKKYQSIRQNKTVGGTIGGNVEIKGLPIGIGGRLGVFHNTYQGWGIETGINVSINAGRGAKGPLSGSLGITNNSQSGLNVEPSLSVSIGKEDASMRGSGTLGTNYNSRSGLSGLTLSTEVRKNYSFKKTQQSSGIGHTAVMSFATPSYTPSITMPLTNSQFAFTAKLGIEGPPLTFGNVFIEGYVSKQYIDRKDTLQTLPAYGYLHYSDAKNNKSLLDFNREKDIAFNEKTSPHIAIPQYTYDIYSISGEGTGGMFRPYRGDVGYINDHYAKTKSISDRLSGDFGLGAIAHAGADFSNTIATTESGAWINQNAMLDKIRFSQSDTSFQEVYFRNPGEKALNATAFYNQFGGDSLIRVKLGGENKGIQATSVFTKFSNAKPAGDINVNKLITRPNRDKRTQVISYLNAEESEVYGLDKSIKSYHLNSNPVLDCDEAYTIIPRKDEKIHKAHHLSEIRVLNADGRRYIYGLPAYNIEQQEVTFSVDKETISDNISKGLANYTPYKDNRAVNNKGKDNYYNKEVTPAFAHSFLLTGLLSPDYIDIKGDGITEDDLGDGVKFNYTQVYGEASGYYNWRTPYNADKANYNEGLKTYSRDDKGTYIYGKKEVWYMHSIESKTMIALFKISDRTDMYSVSDENGGINTSKKLKKLDSIQLFVKADLVKNGTAARPVKTVHFEYTYDLCKNVNGDADQGKLTLQKVWFTYNGNNKGKLNPYRFYYSPDAANEDRPLAASNPTYNPKTYDRWGNYKDPSNNPEGLNNIDYPYATQDSAQAAAYSSVWHLTDIKLPSGGRLKVTYEGDDYGYVQNKRAAQFFKIAGFGETSSSTPVHFLYSASKQDYRTVFINVTTPVTSKADIYSKYLDGIEKFYCKVAVKMPTDKWGSGYEFVPTYGEIEDYGTVSGNTNRFWVRLKAVNGESPITLAALQFLRLNLPSKAYPGSELGDNIDLGGAVKMLVSGFNEIKNMVQGFGNASRAKGWCKQTIDSISFIRLNNPLYKKYGGGIRVKKVQMFDNWNKMTTKPGVAGLKESVYGQEYIYTTTKQVAGQQITISSGVASYEPMIGAEENPFRTPIEYIEKAAPLSPTNYSYTETPLGESFFPSPMVGYSKVRVRTINAKAKSANGWEETQFFTTKDFPTLVEFTPFDGDSRKRYNPKLKNFLRINAQHYMTLSQGFKVELNDMNGKIKSQASFPENDPFNAIHYTENFYKVDDDLAFQKKLNNNVWTIDSTNGAINKQSQIGKEVEIMVDLRQQLSLTTSRSISTNIDVIPAFALPIPIPSKIGLPQHEENRYRSVAVMKIVQRYGILDSIMVRDKGSIVSTKNLVYDGETGNVLLSRTNNEFNDPVYNFNYPAHWAYSGMGLAYTNTDVVLSGKKIIDGKMVKGIGVSDPAEKFFESGDEIMAVGIPRSGVTDPANGNDCPENLFNSPITPVKLWAIDASKGKQLHQGIYFIDSSGKPYSGKDVSMRILRSGKRNLTDGSVGAITSLASPIKEVSDGVFKIVIDSNTRVINTTAAVFKDMWKVENSLYQTDSCYSLYKEVYGQKFYPTEQPALFRYIFIRKSHNPPPYSNILSSHFVASSLKKNLGNRNNHVRYNLKSVLKFDLSSIKKDAVVTSAILNMQASAPRDAWKGVNDSRLNFFSSKTSAHYLNGDLRGRTNESIIKKAGPWSLATPYLSLPTGSTQVSVSQAADETCTDKTATVTDFVSSMVASPLTNYGFVLDLKDQTTGISEDNSSERTLAFCATPPVQQDMFKLLAVPTGCTTCDTSTYLTVNYSYYKDTCVKICRNNINDTALNPYRWGVLGNWRMDRSYTYYHDRQENDASNPITNIRKEGELKQFFPYWQFASNKLATTTDTVRWVWNSAITQYNRKGFEIENKDPLGRYNSGLYGYNQTVPVAVGQNSQARELLADGFEDYSYKTQNCGAVCESPREIDFLKGNSNASIQQVTSHSGRNSLAVTAGNSAILNIPVTADTSSLIPAALSIVVDSTPVYNTTVTAKGTGLAASYKCLFGSPNTVSRIEGPINFNFNTVSGLPNCTLGSIVPLDGIWSGILQPEYTDDYTFYLPSANNTAALRVNNQIVIKAGSTVSSVKLRLEAGKLYPIQISLPSFYRKTGALQLSWSSTQYQSKEIIPLANLYPPTITTADTIGSVNSTIRYYCVKLNNIQPEDVIRPYFSPIQGRKVVVSGWINTDPAACVNPTVTTVPKGSIKVQFDNAGTEYSMFATGVPIEGWQRYEGVVTIPSTATQMSLKLQSATGVVTYFDDIRVQPYNSQLKSFVYDPVNLRLMAELDENNYASFYEYDDDGTLIRVKKETEKGIKTISETRSALLKED